MKAETLARMPEMIIEICVNVGDNVCELQTMGVLKAMKMEDQVGSRGEWKRVRHEGDGRKKR